MNGPIMNISFTNKQEKYIRDLVASGNYKMLAKWCTKPCVLIMNNMTEN